MRVLRGICALAALLIGLLGIPAALVFLGGNPLPSSLSLSDIQRALLTPDDGTILIGLITIGGWIAWLVFAVAVLAEVIKVASGYRLRIRLPGLAGVQRFTAGLLVSVIAMSVGSQPVRAEPTTSTPFEVPIEPVHRDEATGVASTVVETDVGHVHLVQVGDDLWSLAEHYYGSGRQWHKIAMANKGLLTGGPDRLQPGWRLRVPDIDISDVGADARSVLVKPGDTLSSIARAAYGNDFDWRRIFHANRAQLNDPDELVPGMRLVMPQPKQAARPERKNDQPGEGRDSDHRSEKTPEPTVPPPAPTLEPAPSADAEQDQPPADQHAAVALGLASLGSLFATGMIAGLAFRRRVQLYLRPVGRRIVPLSEPARRAEVILGQRQQPLSLRTLDLATRAIAAHCHRSRGPLPRLHLARVSNERIQLSFLPTPPMPPAGFKVHGDSWLLDRDDRQQLLTTPGMNEAMRPYPSLVAIGHDDQQNQLLLDLEGVGLLALDGPFELAAAVLGAITTELAFSPSVDEMVLTLVGDTDGVAQALGKHNVNQVDDLDMLLDRLERRARIQRAHQPSGRPAGHHRVDPDLSDAWAPEIILIGQVPTVEQSARLVGLITPSPRVPMAAVVAAPVAGAPCSIKFQPASAQGETRARLEPLGVELTPQLIELPARQALVELVAATGAEETTPAPWWQPDEQPVHPPDNLIQLGERSGGWTNAGKSGERQMAHRTAVEANAGDTHPLLQLLGPIKLLGATGPFPPRAEKQCLEYCAWLLENHGATAVAMSSALAVAEGTRRSNMSRLRTWLGSDPDGEPYLPDAYTGRIVLHPAVSSDWRRFQILTSPGINRSTTSALRTALTLVRGAPLADAAPGQWHWAEELRMDMVSAIRDLGVELANRALSENDLDVARWAASRALAAAPGDELLMAARIRTEHRAGNVPETERLALQVSAQARSLGLDLDPETVILLQEVIEGRVRARMA
jgi:LysM domain